MSILGKLANEPRLSVWGIKWPPLRAAALIVSIVLMLPTYLAVVMVAHIGAALYAITINAPSAFSQIVDDVPPLVGIIILVLAPLLLVVTIIIVGLYAGSHEGISACVRYVRSLPWRIIGDALLLREVRL